jgi:hypothetical protein
MTKSCMNTDFEKQRVFRARRLRRVRTLRGLRSIGGVDFSDRLGCGREVRGIDASRSRVKGPEAQGREQGG